MDGVTRELGHGAAGGAAPGRRQSASPPGLRFARWALGCVAAAGLGLSGCVVGGDVGVGAAEDRPLEVRADTLFRVGALDGAEWETFQRITAVGFDEEGGLLILDGSSARAIKVDPSGQHQFTAGGRGEGPGELRGAATGLSVLERGAFLLWDPAGGAYRRFSSEGVYIGSHRMSQDLVPAASRATMHPSGALLRWDASVREISGGEEPRPAGVPLRFEPLDEDGSREVARLWRPTPLTDRVLLVGPGQAPIGREERVHAPGLHVAVLADGRIAVSDSSDYRIRLYGPDGAVAGELRRPIEPVPVTDAMIREERTRRLAEIGPAPSPAQAGMVLSPDGSWRPARPGEDGWRLTQEKAVAALEFWSEIPVIEGIAVDRRGRLWVERVRGPDEDGGAIDLFSGEGRYLGTIPPGRIRMPLAFGPDDVVAWVERDELGVEYVRVARLSIEEGGGDD